MSGSQDSNDIDLVAVGFDDDDFNVSSLREGLSLGTWSSASTASSTSCPASSALSISSANCVS
ncbi:thiocillin family RiPP [Spiractinospora alimapuensis]|uniref:thiocillin family RiPP n=1 Tax=Spiractinospora alimapuensis TaxID=2820884 RepID=UPI001F3B18F7|nr:thiocillin family RiPP [Spiractinospora alimapuensis]QVQ50244.1 thiocillin family RiPP [Spiractinospora alimapuensis]